MSDIDEGEMETCLSTDYDEPTFEKMTDKELVQRVSQDPVSNIN